MCCTHRQYNYNSLWVLVCFNSMLKSYFLDNVHLPKSVKRSMYLDYKNTRKVNISVVTVMFFNELRKYVQKYTARYQWWNLFCKWHMPLIQHNRYNDRPRFGYIVLRFVSFVRVRSWLSRWSPIYDTIICTYFEKYTSFVTKHKNITIRRGQCCIN
jgi:hypothetical protein